MLEALEVRDLPATLFVAPSGSDGNYPGNPSAPLRSIQHAVTVAASGDVILLAAGTYGYDPSADREGNYTRNFGATTVVTVINKHLSIVGGYSATDWSNYDPIANQSIIDGGYQYRGIWVEGYAGPTSLTLKGVTITRGVARGIPKLGGSAAIDGVGGGMLVNFAPVLIQDVMFVRNQALGAYTDQAIGGAGAGGGLALRSLPDRQVGGSLVNVAFVGNVARAGGGTDRGGYGHGGGLFTAAYNTFGSNLVFTDNVAYGGQTSGDGIDPNGELADAQGGGLDIHIDSVANLNGVRAERNYAIGAYSPGANSGGAYGAGIYSERATLSLTNATVRSNTARGGNGDNGATAAAGFANGGGLMTINTDTTISQSTFVGNVARGGDGDVFKGVSGGGGIALVSEPWKPGYEHVTAQLTNILVANNCVVYGNGPDDTRGGGGGGIWIDGPTTTIRHATVAQNQLIGSDPNRPTQLGQGIVVGPAVPTVVALSYSIIADHRNNLSAGRGYAAALHVLPGSTIYLGRNLFANNSNPMNANGMPAPAGRYVGIETNFYANWAGFVNPGSPAYDYRIDANSAAVDKGNGSNVAIDLLGRKRTGIADLGAFES